MLLVDNKIRLAAAIIIITILSVWVGFLAGRFTSQRAGVIRLDTQGNQASQPNNLYTNQNAAIRGMIAAQDGNFIDVVNINGVQGRVELMPDFATYEQQPQNASPSAEPKIITNRDCVINLVYSGGSFKVVSINYLPAFPRNFR